MHSLAVTDQHNLPKRNSLIGEEKILQQEKLFGENYNNGKEFSQHKKIFTSSGNSHKRRKFSQHETIFTRGGKVKNISNTNNPVLFDQINFSSLYILPL